MGVLPCHIKKFGEKKSGKTWCLMLKMLKKRECGEIEFVTAYLACLACKASAPNQFCHVWDCTCHRPLALTSSPRRVPRD